MACALLVETKQCQATCIFATRELPATADIGYAVAVTFAVTLSKRCTRLIQIAAVRDIERSPLLSRHPHSG